MRVSASFPDWLKSEVTPLLKGRGFVRGGANFRRKQHGNCAMIHFQRSVKSSASQTLFTATLGVWSRRIAAFVAPGEQETATPAIEECHWTFRLGELLEPPDDHWWTLTGNTDDRLVKQEVTELLEIRAVPLLERMSTDEALRELWLSGASPGLTDYQRLIFLSTLIHEIGPPSLLRPVVEELQRVTRGKPVAAAARAHITRILETKGHGAGSI